VRAGSTPGECHAEDLEGEVGSKRRSPKGIGKKAEKKGNGNRQGGWKSAARNLWRSGQEKVLGEALLKGHGEEGQNETKTSLEIGRCLGVTDCPVAQLSNRRCIPL